jgi:hypothetical protein
MSWLICHQPIIDWANQSVVSFKSYNKTDFINENYISLSNAILVSESANPSVLLSNSQKRGADPVCDGPVSTPSSDSVPVCDSLDSPPVRTSNHFSVLSESEPCCEDNIIVESTRLTSTVTQSKDSSASKQKPRCSKRRRLLCRSAESGTPDQGLSSETLNALIVGSNEKAIHSIILLVKLVP